MTTAANRIAVRWTPRTTPLGARGAIALGPAALALGRKLAALPDDALGKLAAVAGAGVLAVLGEPEDLPWIDGVIYVGRDAAAPELLVPTALAPSVPIAVLATAVKRRVPRALVAVVPSRLVPCDAARAIERPRLAAWLEAA